MGRLLQDINIFFFSWQGKEHAIGYFIWGNGVLSWANFIVCFLLYSWCVNKAGFFVQLLTNRQIFSLLWKTTMGNTFVLCASGVLLLTVLYNICQVHLGIFLLWRFFSFCSRHVNYELLRSNLQIKRQTYLLHVF